MKRYKVYSRPRRYDQGLKSLRTRSFATKEEAEEHAFLLQLGGYIVEITDVEMVPLDTEERRVALRAILSRT